MKKPIPYLVLCLLLLTVLYFSYRMTRTPLPASDFSAPEAEALVSLPLTEEILSDHLLRVQEEFKVPPGFYALVKFWFGVYSRYTSDHIIVHDSESPGLVYAVLDFSRLGDANLHRFARSAIVQRISQEKREEYVAVLRGLADGKTDSRLALGVLQAVERAGVVMPKDELERRKFFLAKAETLRTQTGQRNLIEQGLEKSEAYYSFFKDMFQAFRLPDELFAIPFLESSFNTQAESKVGAKGIWQLMPSIGRLLLPASNLQIDYRLNPFISTVAALHLLRENKLVLRSWDMAVAAYNSGTKHLQLARKQHGARSLVEVFERYRHPHLGFASKNFFAEFLALVHVMAYQDEIFSRPVFTYTAPSSVRFLVSKCDFTPRSLFGKLITEENFVRLNPHLLLPTRKYPRGTLLVDQGELSPKQFLAVTKKDLVKLKPADWPKRLLANQSCSTR